MGFIKTSVCITLLRIKSEYWWRAFIFTLMVVVLAYGVGNAVFILLECRPIQAQWDAAHNPGAQCIPGTAITTASNVGSGVSISTDVLLSLAPISFLWNLNRPLRERIVVSCLMSLGLFAAACSLLKLLIVQNYTKPGVDKAYYGMGLSFWTVMEQLVGIIAGCSPFLKPLLQRCLARMGVSLTKQSVNFRCDDINKDLEPGQLTSATSNTFRSRCVNIERNGQVPLHDPYIQPTSHIDEGLSNEGRFH